jgi:DNA-binding NarL/FixJ family response regulator
VIEGIHAVARDDRAAAVWTAGRPAVSLGLVRLRIVIVDDHPSFRGAARELLRARGHSVVGEADCAASAQELVSRLAPDAVTLDLQLGDECGLELARRLTLAHPGLEVLLVSDERHADPQRVRDSGASGFLPKSQLARADAELFAP